MSLNLTGPWEARGFSAPSPSLGKWGKWGQTGCFPINPPKNNWKTAGLALFSPDRSPQIPRSLRIFKPALKSKSGDYLSNLAPQGTTALT